MDNNVLIAKISASPTDHAWSQAYSTLNLYIVLSLKSKGEEGLLNAGKDLFERIQREYFSLDEKDLRNIKSSVESAIGDFNNDKDISLVLATLKDDVLYIITAGASRAILKRGGKVGTIAKGEEGQVIAFSGELKHGDKVVIETSEFANKISLEKLSQTLEGHEMSEISENLTPIVHESPIGTEAALVINYNSTSNPITRDVEKSQDQEADGLPETEEDQELLIQDADAVSPVYSEKKSKIPALPKLSIPSFKNIGKRKMIIIIIIVLAVVFLVSIFIEGRRQENNRANAALEEILTPAQARFDEATSLLALNQSLALEDFEELRETLEEARGGFTEGSEQRKKLDEFIGKVENEIGKISDGSTITNQKEIFDGAKIATYRDGNLIVVSSNGMINIISADGKSEDEFDSKNTNVVAVTANDSSIYVLGDSGITRTTISNGNTTEAVENPDDTVSIDLFGNNIYGLNVKTNSIDRYSGSSFTQGDYLTANNVLTNPVSIAIDGSIWVIDEGEIRKFTRGAEDSFTVSGLNLSDNSIIFTSTDYNNLYVVDKTSAKVYIISKNGGIENQYTWSELSNAESISADEESSTIYVTADNKLYSFEF